MKQIKKQLAYLLVVCMLLALLPTNVFAEDLASGATGAESTVVIAGSDFQNPSGNTAGAATVTGILTQMRNAGYTSADGFLFCGDYYYDYDTTVSALQGHIGDLDEAVSEVYSGIAANNRIYVQGNHDQVTAGTGGLATSGAHDADAYGVYVINEDDYMWRNSDEATIKNTANALKAYLDGKILAGYGKPVFVVSHLPLHYTMRTYNDGDGKYANYIFDVLNDAGASGLNIIFLYGHDHSNGWDDYLGGSAAYLAKGDKINIAQASQTAFVEETLNFTYMNAGYTGYYENHNGADDTLTMTVFTIAATTVTVERYDANGKHLLKSAGVTNSYKNESGYGPNTAVYESPQYITLGAVAAPSTAADGNVSVTAPGLTGVTAVKNTAAFDTDKYTAYVSYDITPVGYTQGDPASVTITLDADDGFDMTGRVTVIDQTGAVSDQKIWIQDGKVTFTTNHFSTYIIAQEALSATAERTYTRVTNLSELEDGQYLLIVTNESTDYFMLPESVTKGSTGSQRIGFDIETTTLAGSDTITGDYSAKEWTFTKNGSGWIIGTAAGNITLTSTSSYGITATLGTTGDTFTIGGSENQFTFQSGYYLNYNSRGLINGYDSNPAPFYIYRLTSTGTVDPSGGDWVTVSDGQNKTVFRLTDELIADKNYLIVNSNQAGSAVAVNLNNTSINSENVTIIADADGNYIEAPAGTAQWTYTSAGKFQNVSSTGRYLRGNSAGSNLRTTNKTSDSQTTWSYNKDYGLTTNSRYISSSFKMLSSGDSSNRVYIYKQTTLQASAEYAKLTGNLEYTVVPGTSAADALAAVKAGIDVVISSDKSSETTLADDNTNITWTLASGYNGESGEYAVTVYYKNIIIGTAKVTVPELTVAGIEISPMEGTVKTGASNYAKTGSKLTVTYSDGSTRTVDVTLGMISGDFNKNTVGDYTGLTVTYGGKTVTGYTLHVTPKSGNNYPEYPHEGAVRVGKTAEGIDFQSSGIARVELTATGVPVKKGADVIIMVDTSSSMNTTVSGSSKSRIEVLRESLTNLMTQLQAVGADGEAQDIRIAIADFNGYEVGDSSNRYYLDSNDHLTGATIRGGTNTAQVYTGTNGLNAEAFVTAGEAMNVIGNISLHSGTNYDYAFDAAYQLGEAILDQNAQDGEERDLFVIFMSDGAPFQYNYFSSNSDTANWNNWLQGTVTDDMWYSGANNYFYNGSGNRHRMAEAIKGNPDEEYTVIRKDSAENYGGEQYMTRISGLGATMYSIGFCLEVDNQITVASMEHVLRNIASDENLYFSVNTADELTTAFNSIGNEIAYAATNARFVDTMGASFDLQMASSTYTLSDGTTDTIEPEITVRAYDIYTNADGVAESEIGKRKGTFTVLETVTFSTDGTAAYSDKKSGNILVNGVICAGTFWYNTTGSAVSIDTNGDGTNDYDLAPETFYWKMGTVNQTELALSYYVYLTGSREGTREAGSYPTNESAALHYTNWLGNEATKDTVSPVLAWASANVSYAFYLVNANGEIIVNKSTGATGSFANKVAVTNPVVYSEVLLNSGTKVQADILASGVLPEGYSLYDTASAYSVWINANGTGGWTITKGESTAATTYVTEHGGDPTTETSTENSGYDYTHTVVWFAVVYTVKAVPDAVVIDYGLPVDIHVLKNDMFYDKGTLQYVGSEKTDGAVNGDAAAAFTTTGYTGAHGTATVIANASAPEDSVIRYTPSDMQMSGAEKFSYAVYYGGSENSGYYYGTVTVIPATSVYYEDSFVTFNNAKNTSEGDTIGVWTVDGVQQEGALQDEDRPGSSSLSAIDANNLYGYDSHYTGFTKYSLGSAHKVTVDAPAGSKANAPEARFTFTGTGFDIISLTDSDSGTITVTVTNTETNEVKRYSVDTYYGYTYNETDGWVVDENAKDTIWQVPVIKAEGLAYGTYEVIIQVAYLNVLDHQGDGSYSFWLDAIRIYDPAKNDTAANNAHKQDDEYAPLYVTLRDLLVEGQAALDIEEPLDGAVFIDGKDSTSNITDYANPGPNNETYLAYGQGVSFKLTADTKPESVQIGVKLAYGEAATLKLGEKDFRTVTTATDMYYRLDGLTWTLNETGKYETGVITLSNSTEGAVISVTNLKFTSTYSEPAVTAFIDAETIEAAPMMMRALYRQEAAVTVFEPEYFSAVWKAGRAKKWSILMVTTSEDVDSITVNGTVITEYIRIREFSFRNPATYKRVWIYKTKINTAGTYTFDVIAYSEDGIAAAPEETVVTVRK
ncbi:MAG: hypothetical protein ACI3W9_05165 [Eubacteriales bacterium]